MKNWNLLPLLGHVLVLVLLVTSCSNTSPTSTSVNVPTYSDPATTKAPTTTTSSGPAKPQSELVAAVSDIGNENFLPWKATTNAAHANLLVYDTLVYYDTTNRKFLPGLAESWEVSPDGLTLTYHLRKGVQYSDEWGEFTSEDVKYNFEKHKEAGSIGLIAVRKIASMEIPDPYTLVCHFKTPQPTFFALFSLGNSGACQGFVSKKFIETVGEEIASQKPIGTGPYKLAEVKSGSYMKFEAKDNHWRVVPEFKTVILRVVPEVSTTVAMLKNREIDMANFPAEQMAGLKAAGLSTESSNFGGGGIIGVAWGGLVIPEDDRYDAEYHNKDPWVDVKVRKAMTISIDRAAITKAIFGDAATPVGVPLYSADMGKYQHTFDPADAKQLLAESGYPNGFTFKAISFSSASIPESARLMEALCAYWQQIGLYPKITMVDETAYGTTNRGPLRTAGEVYFSRITPVADMLDKAGVHLMPGAMAEHYMDAGSYAIWMEGKDKVNAEERELYVERLNQYYYENFGPIPLLIIGSNWAWNPEKISPFPQAVASTPLYLEYVRHAQALNTFRLFTPMPGR